MPGYTHIPTQSVSRDARERTVAFYAPTKTFSLAGLIGSYHIIYNDRLRCRVQRQGNLSGYNDCNVLSMHALTGAYSDEGMAWVDQLCAVLDRNLRYIRDFLQSRYPVVTMMLPQGTYMLFVNCGAWCRSHGITPDDLRRRVWSMASSGRAARASATATASASTPPCPIPWCGRPWTGWKNTCLWAEPRLRHGPAMTT